MNNESRWIQTYTGKQFFPFDPSQDAIDILDIAHALSMMCRFTGHTKCFYSVAQHSVLVSRIVPPEFALQGLLHDAAEAYLGDIASPLKPAWGIFQETEDRLLHAICSRFGVSWPIHPVVKQADMAMLMVEKRDLMAQEPAPWFIDPYRGLLPLELSDAWQPSFANGAFRERFDALYTIPCH